MPGYLASLPSERFFSGISKSLEMIENMYRDTEAFCHYIFVKFFRNKKKGKVNFTYLGGGKNQESQENVEDSAKKCGNCEEKALAMRMTLRV